MRRFSVTASEADGNVPVLASYERRIGIPAKTRLSLMQCKACNTKAVLNKTAFPGCPCCASVMEPALQKDVVLERVDFSKMEKVADCPQCGSTIATPKDMQASIDDGKLYCPVCSHVLQAEGFSDEEDEETDDDEMSDVVTVEDNTDEDEDEAGFFDVPPMASDDDQTGANTNPNPDPNQADNSGENNQEQDPNKPQQETVAPSNLPNGQPTSTPPPSEGQPDGNKSGEVAPPSGTATPPANTTETVPPANTGEGNTEGAPKADGNTEVAPENAPAPKTDSLNASVMPLFANKDVKVEIVPSSDFNQWFLMADGKPVATAEVSRAGETVQTIFKTDKFREAFGAAISEGVTQETLDNFGFEPNTVEVPVDEAVRQQIAAQVEEITKKYNQLEANLVDRFQTCVGIAAVGINKGIFKNRTNPLKTALIAALKNRNIANAETIVDDAFEHHGEETQRQIVEEATELMEKTPEALNEVSAMVENIPYVKTVKEAGNKNVLPFSSFASSDLEADQVKPQVNELAASDNASSEPDYSALFRSLSGRR